MGESVHVQVQEVSKNSLYPPLNIAGNQKLL